MIPICIIALAAIAFLLMPVPTDSTPKTNDGTIVSIAPSVTEIIFALGLQENLIAVSTACDYPEAAKALPKSGDFGAPSLEIMQKMRPKFIIGTSLRDKEMADAFHSFGSKYLQVSDKTFADILLSMRQIAEAAGRPEAAEKLIAELQPRIDAATAQKDVTRPRVFVEISEKPLITAGRGTFIDDMITLAGGTNIANDTEGWTVFGSEGVVTRKPDIIILAYPREDDAQKAVASRIGWNALPAVRDGYIITRIHPDLISRPGPRLVEGLEALKKLFDDWRIQMHNEP